MKTIRRLLVLSLSTLALLGSGSANAIFRAYLSSAGSDANPCTLPAPCRLMPAALAAVDAGGEIWMLDSANFNTATVVINKSVTIVAIPGALGSIVGNGGDAIQIATAGIDVTLQNLNILKLSGDGDGIKVSDAGKVLVKGCSIFGFSSVGFAGVRAENPNPGTVVTVEGSTVRGNFNGIVGSANARIVVDRTQVLGSTAAGLYSTAGAAGTTIINASDSVLSGNGYGGLAQGDVGGTSQLNVVRSTITDNGIAGLMSSTGSTALVTAGGNLVTGNNIGLLVSSGAGAVFQSLGNNTVVGNTTNTSGTIGPQTPL